MPDRVSERRLFAPVFQLELPGTPFRLLNAYDFEFEFQASALRRQTLLRQLQLQVARPPLQPRKDRLDVVTGRQTPYPSEGQAPLKSAEEFFQDHDLRQVSVIYLKFSQIRPAAT